MTFSKQITDGNAAMPLIYLFGLKPFNHGLYIVFQSQCNLPRLTCRLGWFYVMIRVNNPPAPRRKLLADLGVAPDRNVLGMKSQSSVFEDNMLAERPEHGSGQWHRSRGCGTS